MTRYLKIIFITIIIATLVVPWGYYVVPNESDSTINNTTVANKEILSLIINLDRSPQRLAYVKDPISKLGFDTIRIPAIDGNKLSNTQIAKKLDSVAYQNYLGHSPKKGSIGCYMSHVIAWQRFLDSPYRYAVIFEDDITFDSDMLKTVINELVNYHELWDVTSFELSHRGNPLTIKELSSKHKLSVYLTEVTHTGAYIINRQAAVKLLTKAFPIKMPIDHYFTRAWEFGIKFTGIENPRIVHQSFGNSDISATKDVNQKARKKK
ncbi:MAG: glycosyltransferase family 25 protein, partial [Pseudomonadota bacterium]